MKNKKIKKCIYLFFLKTYTYMKNYNVQFYYKLTYSEKIVEESISDITREDNRKTL